MVDLTLKKMLFFIALLLQINTIRAYAQEGYFTNPTYSEKFIEQQERMLENLDTLFPRFLLKETYDSPYGPITSQEDGFSFTTHVRNGHAELTITSDGNNDEGFNLGWDQFQLTGSYENFYYHANVQLIEQDDSENGYVFFQYTNSGIVGQEKRCAATIYYPEGVEKFITKPSGHQFTTLYVIENSDIDYDVHTLEIIRLNGYTSIFIDRHFVVGFEDEFDGKFYTVYGIGLNPGGEYATYAFDNFIIRRQ